MKNAQYLWNAPLIGALLLAGCSTAPPKQTTPEAGAAVAAPARSVPQWVNVQKNAPPMVSVGDQFTYDLNVTAASDVSETTVVDTIPAGASYVSSEPAATRDGDRLTWKLGNMNGGETRTLKVAMKADKEGELVYCTSASATPRVCSSTTVGRAQLAAEKTGPATVQLGQQVTYTITIRNTGNTPAKNVVVTDPVPEGLSAGGQSTITVNVGDLAAGASKTVPVTLTADKRGKICNKATVASSNAGKVDVEACTTVVQPGLKIEKTTKDKELFMNRSASYDIVVSNTGDTDLSGVVVTDTAAPETVIVAAEGAMVRTNIATWNVGELKAGEKKSLAVKVLSRVPGKFCDTASVTTAQGIKASAEDCTEWKGVTGVLLEMIDDPDPIQVGETSKFTISVSNQGAAVSMQGLKIVATVADELEVIPATVSDGGVVDGKTITWPTVATVAPKASVVRTYNVKALKPGDSRSKVSITTTARTSPIEEIESTTIY